MTVGRVALIVLGTVGALLGLALLVGGGFLLWADRTEREDGYLTTPTERFVTSSYALTRTRLEVDADGPAWLWNDNWFGKIRVRGESAAGKLLFIGIAPEPAVARYLGDVAHANVEDIEVDPFRVRYRAIAGGPPQGPPTAQHFWAVSASGVGQQTVTWKVREGDWSVVLMNADGSRGVVRRRRPRGQAVLPALARGRAARWRWVCPRWEYGADHPRRAQASGAAHAAGACLREQRGK